MAKDLVKNKKKTRIFSTITGVLMIPILLFAFLISISTVYGKLKNKAPSLLGYTPVVLLSSSMEASGLSRGDTVLIKRVGDRTKLKTGDFIAFYKPAGVEDIGSVVWFHEIVEIKWENGQELFRTKGSSNALADDFWVLRNSVLGVYAPTASWINRAFGFFGSVSGIVVCVIIPAGVLLMFYLMQFLEELDVILMERRIVKHKLPLTDKAAVRKGIGYGMRERDKQRVLEYASAQDIDVYGYLLWGEKALEVLPQAMAEADGESGEESLKQYRERIHHKIEGFLQKQSSQKQGKEARSVRPAASKRFEVDVAALELFFANGETVNAKKLQDAGLLPKTDGITYKIEARGRLTKQFRVEADAFSARAVKRIAALGGSAVKR